MRNDSSSMIVTADERPEVVNSTVSRGTVTFYRDYSHSSMANTAVLLCGQLGALSIVLNLFVISALVRHRHRVLSNVFYVIVLHCAVLDAARGCCLIMYGLPYFANKINLSIGTRIALFRGSTFALVILRICNLLTIFNLLVFTSNEFFVIRYPLQYRRWFRRKAVFLILSCCWIVSTVLGLGLLFPTSHVHAKSEDDSVQIDLATVSLLVISILCFIVLATVVVCYAFILRTIKKFKEESSCLNNEDSHRIHNRSVHKTIKKQGSNVSSSTRWKGVQAVSRHKYIYVIGSVLMVDLLFLCPYSGIQLVAFLHINNLIEITHGSTLIRWWLQVLIGVHSVCQPLCYFRMTEFRRLACCGVRKTKNFSQNNKSFINTRSGRDDDVYLNTENHEPLLNEKMASPKTTLIKGESARFRKYPETVSKTPPRTIEEDVEMTIIVRTPEASSEAQI